MLHKDGGKYKLIHTSKDDLLGLASLYIVILVQGSQQAENPGPVTAGLITGAVEVLTASPDVPEADATLVLLELDGQLAYSFASLLWL